MEYMNQWNRIVAKVRKNCTAKEEIIQSDWETLFQFAFDYDESDIDAQRAIKMGSTSKKPDIILRKDEEDLFVIELKQYTIHDGREQLFSYLNQLKMNLGVVVCDKLYLYDYDFTQKENPYTEVEIPFEENNEDGAKFIELFSKDNFDKQKISDFIRSKSNSKDVIAKIKNETTSELIKDLLKAHFKAKYAVSDEDFDSAISSLSISVNYKMPILKQSNTVLNTDSFYASHNATQHFTNSGYMNNGIESEIAKVQKRLPKWFMNKNQYNSKILYAFLKLYNQEKGYVLYDDLQRTANLGYQFKSNFDQMKNFGEKNHGKIFEQVGNCIYLWEETKEIVLKYWQEVGEKCLS